MTRFDALQTITDLFVSETVVDLPTIRKSLGGVTPMTAFRNLKHVPYRRSYNHNGRYYTQYDASRFDSFGLWSWKGIHFSVEGSLRNTVLHFVQEATSGMTQRELRDRLGVRVHNTLFNLLQNGDISRERVSSIFVYLHPHPTTRDNQLRQRQQLLVPEKPQEVQMADFIIIEVLLVLVRHPNLQPAEVARHLRGHSPPISLQQVQAVFDRYALKKKRLSTS